MAGAMRADRWCVHFVDRDSVEVVVAPAMTHEEVLTLHSGALAAEPVPNPDAAAIPSDVTATFEQCVKAGVCGDDERAALPGMFAIDAEATRALVAQMHDRIGRCRRCEHFRRPGLSDGYCTDRDDLAIVYGLLRVLPEDKGADCLDFARSKL